MRLVFFILLLANALAFGYFMYREQHPSEGRASLPQVNAQQIRVKDDASNAHAQASLNCWSWRGFTTEELGKAKEDLDKLALGEKLSEIQAQEYWLHIPPQKNKVEAEKKIAELENLGITDVTLVDETGKWRFAVSFKAYPTEDEAVVHLNQLKEKGVKTAKIVQRDTPTDGFLINQADEQLAVTLKQLQAAYPNSELKRTECATP